MENEIRRSKPLGHADECGTEFLHEVCGDEPFDDGFDFTAEMLCGDPTAAINFDRLMIHPERGPIIMELLLCANETLSPEKSHPKYYWKRNANKFASLWIAKKQCCGELYLVNYAKPGTPFADVVELIQVLEVSPAGIVVQTKTKMTREEFKFWMKRMNEECIPKDRSSSAIHFSRYQNHPDLGPLLFRFNKCKRDPMRQDYSKIKIDNLKGLRKIVDAKCQFRGTLFVVNYAPSDSEFADRVFVNVFERSCYSSPKTFGMTRAEFSEWFRKMNAECFVDHDLMIKNYFHQYEFMEKEMNLKTPEPLTVESNEIEWANGADWECPSNPYCTGNNILIKQDYILNVPEGEEEIVKSLGARYDPYKKVWYITYNDDKNDFEKYLLKGDIERDIREAKEANANGERYTPRELHRIFMSEL